MGRAGKGGWDWARWLISSRVTWHLHCSWADLIRQQHPTCFLSPAPLQCILKKGFAGINFNQGVSTPTRPNLSTSTIKATKWMRNIACFPSIIERDRCQIRQRAINHMDPRGTAEHTTGWNFFIPKDKIPISSCQKMQFKRKTHHQLKLSHPKRREKSNILVSISLSLFQDKKYRSIKLQLIKDG